MSDHSDIKQDIRDIKDSIKNIEVSLGKNTTSLEAHMARTAANEHRIERMENWLVGLITSILLAVAVDIAGHAFKIWS